MRIVRIVVALLIGVVGVFCLSTVPAINTTAGAAMAIIVGCGFLMFAVAVARGHRGEQTTSSAARETCPGSGRMGNPAAPDNRGGMLDPFGINPDPRNAPFANCQVCGQLGPATPGSLTMGEHYR
jgi:hypothetical protein